MQNAGKAQVTASIQRLAAELDKQLAHFVPAYMVPSSYIPLAEIPMMAAGKLDRQSLRKYAATLSQKEITTFSFSQKGRHLATNSTEQVLKDVWSDVLNIDARDVPLDVSFIHLGGDSISAMQVVSRCRSKGILTTTGAVMTLQTIERLSAACSSQYTPCNELTEEKLNQPFDLSPIQAAFFNWHVDGLDHFNQSYLLGLKEQFPSDIIQAAFTDLVDRHSILRARFQQTASGQWQQLILASGKDTYRFTEHLASTKTQICEIAQDQQSKLNIRCGPVFSVDLFKLQSGQQFVLLTAHHLVVDLVSWRILWHEIERRLHNDFSPSPSVSFLSWCQLQHNYGRNLRPTQVLPYTVQPSQYDYWGMIPSDNTYENSIQRSFDLTNEISCLILGKSNEPLRTEPIDILTACLLQSFSKCFPDRKLPAVFLEGHGREKLGDEIEVDVFETIGWFTTLCPIQIPDVAADDSVRTLKLVKDTRRRLPGKGLPYFACSHYSAAGRNAFGNHTNLELVLNYAGHFQQLERANGLFINAESLGVDVSLPLISNEAQRASVLEVNAVLEDGRMKIIFDYHRDNSRKADVENYIKLYSETLICVVRHLADAAVQYSLSDFPLLEISYTGLEKLERQLSGMGVKLCDVQDIYPCTPIQEGIALSADSGTASYELMSVWNCFHSNYQEKIRPGRLISAWRDIVRRHTILATIFMDHPETGRKIQIVLANVTPKVAHFIEKTDNPADFLSRQKPPSMSGTEPLHMFSVCEGNNGMISCRLDIHHMLCDAISMAILLSDLSKAYEGVAMRPATQSGELIKHIAETPKKEKLSYWKALLENVRPCRILSEHAVTANSTCSTIQLEAPSNLSEFCRNNSITRSTFLQAAWALVLTTFTDMVEVCFGYITSGRDANHEDVESVVGPYISLLVAVINLQQPVSQLLERTQQQTIQSLGFQHTSLADIQHEIGVGTLFNTCMTVKNHLESQASSLNGLRFCSVGGEDPNEVSRTLRFLCRLLLT